MSNLDPANAEARAQRRNDFLKELNEPAPLSDRVVADLLAPDIIDEPKLSPAQVRKRELAKKAAYDYFHPKKETARIPDPLTVAKPPEGISLHLFRTAVISAVLVWRTTGVQPTANQLRLKMRAQWPLAQIEKLIATEEFALEMNRCGVVWNTDLAALTPRQTMAILAVADPLNTMPLNAKLRKLGVEPKEWASWKKQPVFQQQLVAMTFDLANEYRPEVDAIVTARALEGNLAFINYMDARQKALNEETSPAAFQQKVRSLLASVFEALSTELADQPEVLGRIASRLNQAQQRELNS